MGTFEQRHRRRGLAVFAGLVALSAWAGVVGLAGGGLDPGPMVTARLPFVSTVFGGIALALVVALPTSILAWLAWRGDERTDVASVLTGGCVMGWIVVQLLIIREFSFFHPTYLAVGAAFVWAGRRAVRRDPATQRDISGTHGRESHS